MFHSEKSREIVFKNFDVIDVDGFVRLQCSSEVAALVSRLRLELDTLLEHKLSHPGATEWHGKED